MLKSQTSEYPLSLTKGTSLTTILLMSILGYIVSVSNIVGAMSPLNVAVVAGASLPAGISAFMGSVVGYILTRNISGGIAHISAMVFVLVFKFLLSELRQKEDSATLLSIVSGFSFLLFGLFFNVIIAVDSTVINLFETLAQSMLCASSAYFGVSAIKTARRERMLCLSGSSGVSLSILYVLIISTLTSTLVLGVNLGRVFGVFFILVAIKRYRNIGGAICGVLTACGIILASPTIGQNTVLLSTAGLISGVFQPFGSLAFVVVFLVTNGIGLLTFGVNPDTFYMILDCCIGTLVFLIVPSNFISQLLSLFGINKKGADFVAINSAERLRFASNTIGDIRSSLSDVTKVMLARSSSVDLSTMVSEKVCSKCNKKVFCWTSRYDSTNDAFSKVSAEVNKGEKITIEEVDKYLNGCPRAHLLSEAFNELNSAIIYDKQIVSKMKELQATLTTYFYSTEQMLSDFSKDLLDSGYADFNLSSQLNHYLSVNISHLAEGCIFIKQDGKVLVEIYAPKNSELDRIALCSDISDIVDRELTFPEVVSQGDVVKINLWEVPELSIDVGASQISGSRGIENGDSYDFFYEKHGTANIILSDGMGSGKRAKLDSLLTSTFLAKLLKSGVGYETAIQLINSSLKIKGWEESFATLDLTQINLYTGKTEIVKSGASATYVFRDDQLVKIESNTLPIGILDDISPAVMNAQLLDGDIVLLVSDGVSDSAEEPIRKTIIKNRDMGAKTLADKLANCALDEDDSKRHDDITIVVIMVKKVEQ